MFCEGLSRSLCIVLPFDCLESDKSVVEFICIGSVLNDLF